VGSKELWGKPNSEKKRRVHRDPPTVTGAVGGRVRGESKGKTAATFEEEVSTSGWTDLGLSSAQNGEGIHGGSPMITQKGEKP